MLSKRICSTIYGFNMKSKDFLFRKLSFRKLHQNNICISLAYCYICNHICAQNHFVGKNKVESENQLDSPCSLGRLLSLIPLKNWGVVDWLESSPGNNKQALPPWCSCALDWRQLRATEYLLRHRFLVSLSHLMTFSLYNSTHRADPRPSRDIEK